MDDLNLVFDATEDGPEAQRVRDALHAHNFAATGVSAYYPANFYLRTPRGETMAGLLGLIWGGVLHISFLWVDEAARGKGGGTRLIDAAETYARERRCHMVALDTHSFQARPFYEKRGYEVVATIDDYPKGHRKFYLKKMLA